MKLYTILLLSTITFQAQNKFEYNSIAEYSILFQPDSTNVKSRVTTENYMLYISNEKTLFISSNRIALDTIIYNNVKLSDLGSLMLLPHPTSNKRIIKTINSDKLFIYNEIRGYIYKYNDSVNIKWEIKNVKDTINNLPVQKAICNFRGRTYIAWFTTEIPISEGPYKFSGLPGLIISLYDTKKHFQYSLASFRELKDSKKIIFNYDDESISISKKKYFEAEKSYRNNPITLMESQGAVFTEETKRIIKEKFKIRNKSNNNPIELTDD